jgi:hypothetical protein
MPFRLLEQRMTFARKRLADIGERIAIYTSILPSHSYLVKGGVRQFDPRHEDTDRDGRRLCQSSIERSYERLCCS